MRLRESGSLCKNVSRMSAAKVFSAVLARNNAPERLTSSIGAIVPVNARSRVSDLLLSVEVLVGKQYFWRRQIPNIWGSGDNQMLEYRDPAWSPSRGSTLYGG